MNTKTLTPDEKLAAFRALSPEDRIKQRMEKRIALQKEEAARKKEIDAKLKTVTCENDSNRKISEKNILNVVAEVLKLNRMPDQTEVKILAERLDMAWGSVSHIAHLACAIIYPKQYSLTEDSANWNVYGDKVRKAYEKLA